MLIEAGKRLKWNMILFESLIEYKYYNKMKKNFHILGTVEPKGTKKSDKSSLQFHIQLDTG